jgi:cobyrinic acid a,c-diamide synthase
LGYRDAVAVTDSSLYCAGKRVVAHEFHRTVVTFADSYQPAWVYRDPGVDQKRAAVRDGAVSGGVHASFLHTHPAATPDAVARFVAKAAGAESGLIGGDPLRSAAPRQRSPIDSPGGDA